MQNYPNLEFFIIDGGSTDQSVDIIKKYEPWIDYWASESDRGQTHAINKGFKRATGEIINWVNSDDLLLPNALFEIAACFQKTPDVHFLKAKGYYFSLEKTYLFDPEIDDAGLSYLAIFPFVQPACFFKRAVLNEIGYLDEDFEVTMDRDLYVRIFLNYRITEMNFVVAKFRLHDTQKTHGYSSIWHQNRIEVLSRLLRSINTDTRRIEQLKEIKLFIDGTTKYAASRIFNQNEIDKIIAIALYEMALRSFVAKQYKQSKEILSWLKRNLSSSILHQNSNRLLIKSQLMNNRVSRRIVRLFKPTS